MKVQVWSDFRCSFCYIGKRYIEKTFEELGLPLELELMSYELEPDFAPTPGVHHHDKIADARGLSRDEMNQMFDRIVTMAKAVGLHYDYDRLVDANSFKSHKILQYAKQENKSMEFSDNIFEAHFERGLDIADNEVLVRLANDAGLDEQKVREILSTNDFENDVRNQEKLVQQMGVTGVPFFVFDGKVSLSGAQPVEIMKQAIAYTKELD